jgi:transcriptional regulator GlxA family with amidase domain
MITLRVFSPRISFNAVPPTTKFIFVILPEVHLLDLAGPDQVIGEAIDFGGPFEVEYAGIGTSLVTSAGLGINKLKHFSEIQYKAGDYIVVPGARVKYILTGEYARQSGLPQWLADAHQRGANLASICVGAFVLAEAGVLAGKKCTTHFQLTHTLQQKYPETSVQENVLYVSENRIHTSAGIASGIDMMLYLVEQLTSSHFAHKVARELVVYNRRHANDEQLTAYFNYRNHIHSGIHRTQDFIIDHIAEKLSVPHLAEIAHMSERNFTRLFKKETGLTVNEYINQIRIEKLRELLNNPSLSRMQLAQKIGLSSEKQVERLLKQIG